MKTHTFSRGVHPREGKALAEHAALEVLPVPDDVRLPMAQNIGAPCTPVVKARDVVEAGQMVGQAGEPSLPFLMTGFDQKTVTLTNHGDAPANVTLEVDITGTGVWKPYRTLSVPATGSTVTAFPAGFQAYWVRAVSDADARLTVEFKYE